MFVNLINKIVSLVSLVVNPFDSFIFFPNSLLDTLSTRMILASTMSFIISPFSNIHSAIGPGVCALTMFLIVTVVSFICTFVWPRILAFSVFLVIQPASLVHSSILPSASPLPLNFAVRPLSIVDGSINKNICPLTVSTSLLKHTLISVPISVLLYSSAMLHVVLPVSRIPCSCLGMCVDSITISLIVFPLPFIFITIYMHKLTLAGRFTVLPIPLILGTVWPGLNSITLSNVAQPLPLVFESISEFYELSFFYNTSVLQLIYVLYGYACLFFESILNFAVYVIFQFRLRICQVLRGIFGLVFMGGCLTYGGSLLLILQIQLQLERKDRTVGNVIIRLFATSGIVNSFTDITLISHFLYVTQIIIIATQQPIQLIKDA